MLAMLYVLNHSLPQLYAECDVQEARIDRSAT